MFLTKLFDVFPKIHPTWYDPKKPDRSSSGVYRDKLKPLLDSTDAGHLLSIFSYTGEGACIEHVDRGFITLVTKSQEEWGLVKNHPLCVKS